MRYIILLLFLTLFLSACENVRHKIGISAKPFATDGKFEDSAKSTARRAVISLSFILITIIFI